MARMRISENHVDIGEYVMGMFHGITSRKKLQCGFQPGDFKSKKWRLPSGNLTVCYGKSQFLNGKVHHKWPFSIAMLVYQRVNQA